jgi:hypothetical protein
LTTAGDLGVAAAAALIESVEAFFRATRRDALSACDRRCYVSAVAVGARFGNAGMWREYLGFVGAAIAVVNGLIAIVVAMLPVRRSVAKLRLGAAAVVLGVLAVGGTLVSLYSMRVQQERQLSDRREIRQRIDGFIQEGQTLLAQIGDSRRELPTRLADEWAQRTEIFLRGRLGELYVVRFRREVNEMYGDAPIAAARIDYWRAVRDRLVNLEMMAAEFPPPLRPSTVSTPKL